MASRIADFVAARAMRVSTLLGPNKMRSLAKFNKHVTNPVQRRWAHRLPYYALIEHTGRKSGNQYRTPVMAFVEDRSMYVVLNYGTESDWVRNIRNAGSASMTHRGARYRLSAPRIIRLDSPELPSAIRAVDAPERRALHATIEPIHPTALG